MTNEEKILEILSIMQGDIDGIKGDIAKLQEDVAEIKETQAEHTEALNTLIEWADEVQVAVKIPFAKGV